VQGRGRGLILGTGPQLPGGTEENMKNILQQMVQYHRTGQPNSSAPSAPLCPITSHRRAHMSVIKILNRKQFQLQYFREVRN
jgi:hypothetical protein